MRQNVSKLDKLGRHTRKVGGTWEGPQGMNGAVGGGGERGGRIDHLSQSHVGDEPGRAQRESRNGHNEVVFVIMSRTDPNWDFSIRIRS